MKLGLKRYFLLYSYMALTSTDMVSPVLNLVVKFVILCRFPKDITEWREKFD